MSLKLLALGFDDAVTYTPSEVRYEFDNIVDAEVMDALAAQGGDDEAEVAEDGN